jgi:hypothetical protein
LALVDAGIPMNTLAYSVNIGMVSVNDTHPQLILDTTTAEEKVQYGLPLLN